MKFEDLTQIALLGTERQPLAPLKGNGPIDCLLTQVNLNKTEEALLTIAALCELHERVGALPLFDKGPLPETCATEELARMSGSAGSLLNRLLGGEHDLLIPEFFRLAAQAKQLALPEALPPLLSLGFAKPELREGILPILGLRGRWLAEQNPDWSYVIGGVGEDESVWHVGDPASRLTFLQTLRRSTPVRARELLSSTWKEETPEDRARFIGTFAVGLSSEDENFLESALDDKRKEVRQQAAILLANIAQSALVQRMLERTKPLLVFVPEESGSILKFKRGKPASIEVSLPAECDKSMQRDGIIAKPPQGTGEKAWWLMQMIEVVPLAIWTTIWNVRPSDIIAAASATEWKRELIVGWIRGAIRQKNSDWADILFEVTFENRYFDLIGNLLTVMSPTTRESRLSQLLASNNPKIREFQGYLVANCQFEWSVSLSRDVLVWLKRLTAEPSNDWQLRTQIKDFASRLAPSLLADATAGWPTGAPAWEFWSKGMEEFFAVAQFRLEMHSAFTN